MSWISTRRSARRRVAAVAVIAAATVGLGLTSATLAAAAGTVTYSATQTIPVPPASNFAGNAGGDGWDVALSATEVFNVFHHDATLKVACHKQVDATNCWPVRTITDGSGSDFATGGQPGLWLDPATAKLYVYATRTSDITAGVVCVDTTTAATSTNPFCGFTAISAVGHSDISGSGYLSQPVLIGTKWYAVNYVSGVGATADQNALLCFDTATKAGCGTAALPFGPETYTPDNFPSPPVAAFGTRIIAAMPTSDSEELICFDVATGASCPGTWPLTPVDVLGSGTPFPLLNASGAIQGFCIPNGSAPCYNFSGASVPTPAGLDAAIPVNTEWNGSAVVIGPRVYVANRHNDSVRCYDYATSAACPNFPKALPESGFMYTVVRDPFRPTCLWVNADFGSGQIQNFDAYSAGTCGEGPIRVLAASFIVGTQVCQPATYTSLQVLAPKPTEYTGGSITFQDLSGQAIPGIPTKTLDATGTASLSGLNLSTATGLPQFLITLTGTTGTPGSVTVKLVWTGVDDPSCLANGATVTRVVTPPPPPPTPVPPVIPVVVQTDIAPPGAGLPWAAIGGLLLSLGGLALLTSVRLDSSRTAQRG